MKVLNYVMTLILLFTSVYAFAMPTVQYVDLNKYQGKWYEIARFDSWFEKDCVNVTAEYTLNNNAVDVINTCRLKTANGKLKQAHGRATVVPGSNNAKLKVSFLPKLLSIFDPVMSGDYWILKLDSNYDVVLVGDPSKKYLWILARDSKLDQKTYGQYVTYAKNLGFDVDKLHKTLQSNSKE